MVGGSLETADELAARLRLWLSHHPQAPEAAADLLDRAATALEQGSRRQAAGDGEAPPRQASYKEVLATRGEQHRPDGTPVWPLRQADFPSRLQAGEPVAAVRNGQAGDLPDWML